MACDPYAIHVALADQIRDYITADVNVYAWPMRTPDYPSVSVWPGPEYIAYIGTFGANGIADMMLELVIEHSAADDESEFKWIADLLAAGTGFSASLADAVMSDRTLGGVVDDAVVLTAEWSADPQSAIVARLPVQIILSKSGAQV